MPGIITSTQSSVQVPFGNWLRLVVPLVERVRTVVDGRETETDTPYTPTDQERISVNMIPYAEHGEDWWIGLMRGGRAMRYEAEADGTNAIVTIDGSLPPGRYMVEVWITGGEKQKRYLDDDTIVEITWRSDDAGIDPSATMSPTTYTLEGAVFYYAKGDPGRGILRVELVRSVGNVDHYRMTFTDGTYFDYTVTNAAGLPADQLQEIIDQVLAQIDVPDPVTVDDNLDTGSDNPVKNSAIANAIADVEDNITALQEAVFPLAVTLTLSPSLAENNGQSRNVTASWTVKRNNVSVAPESLTLTVGGSQVSVNKTDTNKVLSLNVTTSVTIQATYAGMTKSASKTVTFVLPMYFGFSASASGITPTSLTKQGLKTSPDGSYSLNNSTTGNYMWLCVPSSMSIGTVKSGGFEVPMEAAVTVSGYKCYRSSAALTSGTWDIVIS